MDVSRSSKFPSVLADAADMLSGQSQTQLRRLCRLLKPYTAQLDSRFSQRLKTAAWSGRRDPKQLKALCAITPSAAARMLAADRPMADFFEQVEYNGRRLAKLNVSPAEIVQALREYDQLVDPLLANRFPRQYKEIQSAWEQLRFAVGLTLNNSFYQVREAETQAFYGLFRAELEATDLADLLRRFVGILTRTFRAQAGRLLLLDPAQPEIQPRLLKRLSRPRYIRGGGIDELLILDPAVRGQHSSYWSIPFFRKERMAGLVQFGFSTPYQWLPRELQLLDAAAERCLLAAEKALLLQNLAAREDQVRHLAGHMLQVEEEERRRISRELHDETGQSLLSVRLQLEMLEKTAPPDLGLKLAEARKVAEHTILEIRRIIAALSPAVLEQLGLPAALRQLTSQFRKLYQARVYLHITSCPGRFSREVETVAYRLAQECYQNIAKHSAAAHVKVGLRSTDNVLELSVEDDGVGFDVEAAVGKSNSYGLAGMRERVTLVGGIFQIRSAPGKGTAISIQLPAPYQQAAGARSA